MAAVSELEQFCLLAKAQKGRALAALLQQVINHKKIFVFGELLALTSVQELKDSEFSSAYHTLKLFAYGSFQDYQASKEKYLELSESQIKKLKQLSIISLAAKQKILSYSMIQSAIAIKDRHEFEDLLIDTIYTGLIKAKLDQMHEIVRISSVMARDVNIITDLPFMIKKLKTWRSSFRSIIQAVQQSSEEMAIARKEMDAHQKQLQIDAELRTKEIKDNIEAGNDPFEGVAEGTGEAMRGPPNLYAAGPSGRRGVAQGGLRYAGNKQPRRHMGPGGGGGGTARPI